MFKMDYFVISVRSILLPKITFHCSANADQPMSVAEDPRVQMKGLLKPFQCTATQLFETDLLAHRVSVL